ncbi:hypothetical protein Gotur_018299, partial [Gossypium turneri]
MDTEKKNPYGKRKIESDSQTNDYLIDFDFEKDQNINSILTSKLKNLTINKLNFENTGKSISTNLLGYKTLRLNTHHRHKKRKWKPGNKKFSGKSQKVFRRKTSRKLKN